MLVGGLTARLVGEEIQFSDAAGAVVTRFLAPTLDDAAGAHSDDVHYTLTGGANGAYRLTVTAAEKWLAATERVWPVVLDPSSSHETFGNDCTLSSATPTTSSCGQSTIAVGWSSGGGTKRALLRFPNIYIPKNSVVTSSWLDLYETNQTATGAVNVAAHQVTRTSTNSATWNTADGTTAWTSAGGDYTATPAAVTAVNNAVNPIQRFYVDKLVQGWVDGTIANQGILFKQQVESTTNTQTFGGGNNATTYQRPLLSIEYAARLGTDPSMTFVSKQLSDRMSVQGNVANQNLVVQATDMTIPGVGVDLGLTRTWNSKGFATSSNTIDFGNSSRWVLSLGKSVRIEKPFTGDGHPVLYGPDGRVDSLLSDGAGGFVSTPGLNAKLTKPLSTRYELTYNKSGQKFTFTDSAGTGALYRLTKVEDRNGNAISVTYTSTTRTDIVDTRGRTVVLTYDATGTKLASIVDPTGRSVTYGYNAGGELITVVDADSKTVTYAYSSSVMTQITDARSNQTKFNVGYGATEDLQNIRYITNVGAGTGPTYTWEPQAGNASLKVVDPFFNKTLYNYDTKSRVTKVTDPLGRTRDNTWTANSDAATFNGANVSAVSTATYDANSNRTGTTAPSSNGTNTAQTTSTAYNTVGQTYLPSSGTDEEGTCTAFTYNAAGNPTRSNSGLTPSGGNCDGQTGGVATRTLYNGDTDPITGLTVTCTAKPGQPCRTHDGNNAATNFGYDANGNTTSITPPSPLGAITLTPDGLSRTVTAVDGKGQTTRYTYDAIDRLKQVLYGGAVTCDVPHANCLEYIYDANGNLTSRISGIGTTTYTYDAMNRLTEKALPAAGYPTVCSGFSGMRLAYDDASRLTSYCDAGGTVAYRYDTANNLLSVQEPGGNCTATPVTGACTTYEYAAGSPTPVYQDGRPTKVIYPPGTGVSTVYTYDNTGAVTRIKTDKAGAPGVNLQDTSYTYADSTQDRSLRRSATVSGTATYYRYDSSVASAGPAPPPAPTPAHRPPPAPTPTRTTTAGTARATNRPPAQRRTTATTAPTSCAPPARPPTPPAPAHSPTTATATTSPRTAPPNGSTTTRTKPTGPTPVQQHGSTAPTPTTTAPR